MGLVTICHGKPAKTPFLVEQMGLGLYSLEELAWFLYHNVCLIDHRFFDERLCAWLSEELGLIDLAKRIRSGAESRSNLINLVVSVVAASELYDSQELNALRDKLKALSTMQEQERRKLRADELLDGGNEELAMEEYQRILDMHQNGRLGMSFYAAIWHNLGVCYARQFRFAKAAECFETAYDYAPSEDSDRQATLARQLESGQWERSPSKRPDTSDPQRRLLRLEEEYRSRAVAK